MGNFKQKMRFVLLLLATLLVIVEANKAAHCRKGVHKYYKHFDRNHNGVVTWKESWGTMWRMVKQQYRMAAARRCHGNAKCVQAYKNHYKKNIGHLRVRFHREFRKICPTDRCTKRQWYRRGFKACMRG